MNKIINFWLVILWSNSNRAF